MDNFLLDFHLSLVSRNLDVDTLLFQQFQKFVKKYNKKKSTNSYPDSKSSKEILCLLFKPLNLIKLISSNSLIYPIKNFSKIYI